MTNQLRRAALITGASAGIGREFARQIAQQGLLIPILVARRRERLEQLRTELLATHSVPEVLVLPADLREQSERIRVFEELRAQQLQVELLVNNAGFGSLGPFSESDPLWELDMVRLNCEAPLHFSRLFLPEMRACRSGSIINVCSTASFQPMPYMATYAATKAFLRFFSEALHEELQGSGVRVLAHCPGPTESEFHLVVGLMDKLDYLPGHSAERVVREALLAASRGSRRCVNGLRNKLLTALVSLTPVGISNRAVLRLLRPMYSHVRRDPKRTETV